MLFEGWGQVKIVLGPTHIVQHVLFSLFPSILAVDLDLILGLFWTFLGTWAIFGLIVGFKNCFGVHSFTSTTFIFYDFLEF